MKITRAEMRRIYEQSQITCCALAELAGISDSTVRKYLKSMKVKIRPATGPAPRRFDREEAVRLRSEGLSFRRIGDKLGVWDTTVRRALEDMGIDTSRKERQFANH